MKALGLLFTLPSNRIIKNDETSGSGGGAAAAEGEGAKGKKQKEKAKAGKA